MAALLTSIGNFSGLLLLLVAFIILGVSLISKVDLGKGPNYENNVIFRVGSKCHVLVLGSLSLVQFS